MRVFEYDKMRDIQLAPEKIFVLGKEGCERVGVHIPEGEIDEEDEPADGELAKLLFARVQPFEIVMNHEETFT